MTPKRLDLSAYDRAMIEKDLLVYGNAYVRDGRRLDPLKVTVRRQDLPECDRQLSPDRLRAITEAVDAVRTPGRKLRKGPSGLAVVHEAQGVSDEVFDAIEGLGVPCCHVAGAPTRAGQDSGQ